MVGTMARRSTAGFTLIEMMVAVGILGLLATIALPHYKSSIYRAHRVEAVLALEAINTSQFAYFGAHDKFTDKFSELEFWSYGRLVSDTEIEGRRYSYVLTQPYGERSWYCKASFDLDGDVARDELIAFETRF